MSKKSRTDLFRDTSMPIVRLVATLALVPLAAHAQPDTTFLEVGSPRVDARIFKPHAARVRIYDASGRQTAEWDNELWVGDSAGRPVMRWSTVGRPVAANPNRPLSRLLQTYDGRTMLPLGYVSSSNTGSYLQLTIDGRRVRGVRRPDPRAALETIDLELDVPGWMMGASDLVPVAAGLRTGEVMVAPLWGPNMTRSEYRVFHVMGDTTLDIEGMPVRARKVEERRRSDRSLTATWWLSLDDPYMYYGEVPLPNGGVQRMTEVPIPRAPGGR